MPQPTKPQLAVYAAFAIAVLLIGARFLRGGDAPVGSNGPVAGADGGTGGGSFGAPDGASGGGAGGAGGAGGGSGDVAGGTDSATASAEESALLVVDVKGAVRHPGVYRLAPGARALDAVEKAGGMTRRADRLGVNLAARVADGGEVVVPRRGAGGAAAPVASGGSAPSAGAGTAPGAPLQLDLNTATAQELEQLDGVGPATAAKIVDYRDQHGGIRSVEELDEVSGIGEAKLAAIRAQLGR